jgi:hypothetical protein
MPITQEEESGRSIVIWSVLAVVAILISVATYTSADAGGTYLVWWGPVAFGIWRISSASLVLFRLRNV